MSAAIEATGTAWIKTCGVRGQPFQSHLAVPTGSTSTQREIKNEKPIHTSTVAPGRTDRLCADPYAGRDICTGPVSRAVSRRGLDGGWLRKLRPGGNTDIQPSHP